MNESVSKQMK